MKKERQLSEDECLDGLKMAALQLLGITADQLRLARTRNADETEKWRAACREFVAAVREFDGFETAHHLQVLDESLARHSLSIDETKP